MQIKGGEKIGVVGRTGAGKSTITMALSRLIEASEGSISIDGKDISSMSLHNLRKNITVIPQDAILFNGSLRFNLDPFNERSDDEVNEMIQKAQLKDLLTRDNNAGFNFEIKEGGQNLSAGEKQLISISRAILRRAKIVCLDEATANIDVATEHVIQELLE